MDIIDGVIAVWQSTSKSVKFLLAGFFILMGIILIALTLQRFVILGEIDAARQQISSSYMTLTAAAEARSVQDQQLVEDYATLTALAVEKADLVATRDALNTMMTQMYVVTSTPQPKE